MIPSHYISRGSLRPVSKTATGIRSDIQPSFGKFSASLQNRWHDKTGKLVCWGPRSQGKVVSTVLD